MSELTILIKSNDKQSGNSNDCNININMPKFDNIEMLEVEVLGFSLSYDPNLLPDASIIQLESDLNIINMYSTSKRLLTYYDIRNQRFARNKFNCSNFSGTINFRLMNENGALLKENGGLDEYSEPWVLLLRLKPVD